jgi:hypothetical protein
MELHPMELLMLEEKEENLKKENLKEKKQIEDGKNIII